MTSGRLKEIWANFETRTTRALTNRAIDHIVTTQRADWKVESEAHLPHGFEAPSQAAFAALRTRLISKASKAQKRAAGRAVAAESDTALPELAFAPEGEAARDLIRALKSTEFRTRRPKFDYADALSGAAQKARGARPGASKAAPGGRASSAASAGKPRRKLFGVF